MQNQEKQAAEPTPRQRVSEHVERMCNFFRSQGQIPCEWEIRQRAIKLFEHHDLEARKKRSKPQIDKRFHTDVPVGLTPEELNREITAHETIVINADGSKTVVAGEDY